VSPVALCCAEAEPEPELEPARGLEAGLEAGGRVSGCVTLICFTNSTLSANLNAHSTQKVGEHLPPLDAERDLWVCSASGVGKTLLQGRQCG
jgi:hypothetical protein